MTTLKENKSLIEYLENIKDPRKEKGIRYKLSDILFIILHASLCGYYQSTDIEAYSMEHFDEFKELLDIKKSPSHDTFSRIIGIINFNELISSLCDFLIDNYPELYKKYNNLKVLHVDGKAVKASSLKSNGEKPNYLINSMYEGGSISLYTKQVGIKENEIKIIPEYLKNFNLDSTIVTIDAIGTNENIIKIINERGGNYLLQVKENQKKLYDTIMERVKELEETKEFDNLDSTIRLTKEHGRIEKIKTTMIKNTSFIFDKLGLKSFYGTIARIGVMDKETTTKVDGEYKTTKTRSIVITDLENISVENIESIKLSHWNIEMQHWILDVELNEDRTTSRANNSIINYSVIKRFAIRVQKQSELYKNKPIKRMFIKTQSDFKFTTSLLFNEAIV